MTSAGTTATIVGLAAGAALGQLLHSRVPRDAARRATAIVAVVGASLTVVKGALACDLAAGQPGPGSSLARYF